MNIIALLHYRCPQATINALNILQRQINAQPDAGKWRLVLFIAEDSHTEPVNAPNGVSVFSIKNRNFTLNWNEAFAIAAQTFKDWQFFGFFNNDIIPGDYFIQNLLEPFGDERVGIVSPTFNSPHRFIYTETGEVFDAPYVEFTAPVIRRECFDECGQLSPEFGLGWGVDFEYCARARSKGWRIQVNGKSSFVHMEHKSIKEFGKYAKKAANEMKRGLVRTMGPNWREILLDGWDNNKYKMPI